MSSRIPDGVHVFRYEAGDLCYEPPESAPDDWEGDLADLIGDYIAVESVKAIRSDERSKVEGEQRREIQRLEDDLAGERKRADAERDGAAFLQRRYDEESARAAKAEQALTKVRDIIGGSSDEVPESVERLLARCYKAEQALATERSKVVKEVRGYLKSRVGELKTCAETRRVHPDERLRAEHWEGAYLSALNWLASFDQEAPDE